jgi:hypothetical protein
MASIIIDIIKLCLAIDEVAMQIYKNQATVAQNETLKNFLREMSLDEEQHVIYWGKLLNLAEMGEFTNIFDDPIRIKKELEVLKAQADSIALEAAGQVDVQPTLMLACRLEFYLLHPAFEALFYLMEERLLDKLPVQDYETHIDKLIKICLTFSKLTPELELLMELIKRLWQSNKALALQCANVRTLSRLIPICLSCKKIRDDKGYWGDVETYISKHTGAEFTHGMCPECLKRYHPKHYQTIYGDTKSSYS